MTSIEEIVASILNLTDDEFFGVDQSILAPRESRLLDMDFFGIAVSAPSKITTDRCDKLPLIMAARFSGERDWEVRLKENCILVGTNLQDGTVHFSKAFVSEKEIRSRGRRQKLPKGPKPPGLALEAAQVVQLFPRSLFNISWNTGIWALGVIYYDWASNSVVVELEGDAEMTFPPAPPVNPEPSLLGASGLPCFFPMDKMPQPPDSGVNFTGEFLVKEKRQILNIYGAFTVPVQPFHIPEKPLVHQFQDGRQENVGGIVPVTMAVVGLDWDEPLHFNWAVPVYGTPLATGMLARGCFAIDVFDTGMMQELAAGNYACYIILDGNTFGPKILKVS